MNQKNHFYLQDYATIARVIQEEKKQKGILAKWMVRNQIRHARRTWHTIDYTSGEIDALLDSVN